MRTVLKKIVGSAILLVVAAPLLFSVVLVCRQFQVQREMQEKLETASLQTITLPAANTSWVTPGKEIAIDGKLFDVKAFEYCGNNIRLTGCFDIKEDQLGEYFQKLQPGKDNHSSTQAQLALKYFFFPLFSEKQIATCHREWLDYNNCYHSFIEKISDRASLLVTPPPRLLS